jgi:hypothetical protein
MDGDTHPPVTGVIARLGHGFVYVEVADLDVHQHGVGLRTARVVVETPKRHPGDVALRRDVLDRQLVDVAGVQVVRAADLYLAVIGETVELVGVDVGLRAYLRRLLPAKRHTRPFPARMIDWSELTAFVPRSGDGASDATPEGPAAAAGAVGGAVRLSVGARDLHTLSAPDLASLVSELGRGKQPELIASASSSSAESALRSLSPAEREDLLAHLDASDQARLRRLIGKEKEG